MISHDSELPQEIGQGRQAAILTLTPRQLEVLSVIAEGNSEKQTARLLSISRETVHKHITKSCAKLGVNRIQLIVAFAKWQAVEEGKEQ